MSLMLLLIIGGVVCLCAGVCCAVVLTMACKKKNVQAAQAVPAEALAYAVPMDVEAVSASSIQMVEKAQPTTTTKASLAL